MLFNLYSNQKKNYTCINNYRNMYKYFLIFFSMALFSQKYETQKYDVLESFDSVEIRYYPSVMKAKVTSDKNFDNFLDTSFLSDLAFSDGTASNIGWSRPSPTTHIC